MSKSFLASLTFLGLTLGCGDSGPNLVSVSGIVTINEKPLEGAFVQFSPDPSNKEGQPAEDKTGPAGNYKAMTKGRSGVVPGKYKVVVTKIPTAPVAGVSDQFKDDPFMAKLSADGPEVGKAAKKKDTRQIEEMFDREVLPGGGQLDFDVKATADAALKIAAPK